MKHPPGGTEALPPYPKMASTYISSSVRSFMLSAGSEHHIHISDPLYIHFELNSTTNSTKVPFSANILEMCGLILVRSQKMKSAHIFTPKKSLLTLPIETCYKQAVSLGLLIDNIILCMIIKLDYAQYYCSQ